MKVYNNRGDHKFDLELANDIESFPWKVICSSTGIYYMTDKTHFVTTFNSKGDFQDSWAAVSPENEPSSSEYSELRGLAIDAKDHVLVGEVDYGYISKHELSGRHIASFKVDISPYFLAATSECEAIIVSNAENQVQIVNNSGHVIHTLHPPPVVQNWCPSGVCCNDADIIFICNFDRSDHGICCFSASGEYLGSISVTRCLPRDLAFMKGCQKFALTCSVGAHVYSCKQ